MSDAAADWAEQVSLRYSDRDGQRREFLLVPHARPVVVGRSPDADVALTWDPEVSRVHATLEWIGTHWTIVDDGLSRNGTYVNGERLAGRRRLRTGDKIRVGSSLIDFHDYRATTGGSTKIAAELPTVTSLTQTQRAVLTALCRPYKHSGAFASPATNQTIAEELFLSVDAIKAHLRALFAKFAVEDLPQNAKRVRLVERAMQSGVINERDL